MYLCNLLGPLHHVISSKVFLKTVFFCRICIALVVASNRKVDRKKGSTCGFVGTVVLTHVRFHRQPLSCFKQLCNIIGRYTSYTMVSSGLLQNIPRVPCTFWYTHNPLGECICQENTRDKLDILQ